LGKVVLEAAAAELPIIATRATGVIDIVEDGCNGRLVPIGESTELADTIRELLDNPHVAGTLARQAREYVERMPDKDDFLHALLTLYQTTGASTTRAGSSVAGAASTVELSVGDK